MGKYFFKTLLIFFMMGSSFLSAKTIWDMDPYQVRDIINQKIMEIEADIPEVSEVSNASLENPSGITPVRIYTPDAVGDLPIILFIHGGAWVAGNLDTHDHLARYLCQQTQAIVFSIGYLNSPEGKFPQPLEQCYDSLLWILDHAADFNAYPGRVAVAGDSAGGNMAAALCLMARDRSGPKINLQVLINPSPDLTSPGIDVKPGDEREKLLWYAAQYVRRSDDVYHPFVSPVVAEHLRNLPAACIILAEHDDLKADGQKYADRLRADGVEVEVYTQNGIGHLGGDGARASYRARESLDIAVAALLRVFQQ